MRKIFFSQSLNLEILDESGDMNLSLCNQKYSVNDFQEVSVNQNEGARVVNGVLVKFDAENEKQAQLATFKGQRKTRKKDVLLKWQALGITKSDLRSTYEFFQDGDDN